MCGCTAGIFGVILPRLLLLWMWLFNGTFKAVYNGPLIPFLGLFFAPFTVMAYALMHGTNGMSVIGWIVVGLAVVVDVGAITGTGFFNREQIPAWKQKGYDNP
jgi:hypothetical protein